MTTSPMKWPLGRIPRQALVRALVTALLAIIPASGVLAQPQNPALEAYTGTYEYLGGSVELVPGMTGIGRTLVAVLGSSKYPLRPAGPDRFLNGVGDTITFQRTRGRVEGFVERGVEHKILSRSVLPSTRAFVTPRQASSPRDIPVQRDDGIRVGAAVAELGLADLRSALVERVVSGRYPDVDGVLIYHRGRLVLEEYFYGFDIDAPHELRSATKSVISLLVGIGIGASALPGLNVKALPALGIESGAALANADARKDSITLGHLLSMRSGLACDDWDESSPGNERRLYETADWMASLVALPQLHNPGEVARYCSVGLLAAGRILERATGQALPEYAAARLFRPLGINPTTSSWSFTLNDSNASTFAQLSMRPRDLLKLGMLVLQRGRWGEAQVVPADWIRESTARVTRINTRGYGYGWWQQPFELPSSRDPLYVLNASGNGGQKLYVLPEHDAVVLFTGSAYNSENSAANTIMAELVLPAILRAGAEPDARFLDADSVEALRNAMLPPAATRADLAALDRAYRQLHPGLTRYQPLAKWAARVDSLDRWFSVPRSRAQTYLAFSALVASMQDSHTYLNFWNQPEATQAWLSDGSDKLPFTFVLDAQQRWIVQRSAAFADDSGDSLLIRQGDLVVAVNEQETATLTQRMLSVTRADGANDGKRRALIEYRHGHARQTTDVLLPLIAPPQRGTYLVTVRRAGGADRQVRVRAISAIARNERALPAAAARPSYSLSFRGDIAVLTVDDFALSSRQDATAAFASFLAESFAELRVRGTRSLILDLQRNEGGSDDSATLLLSYLIRAPIRVPSLRRFVSYDTVPADLRPLLQTWDPRFYDRRGSVRRDADGNFTLLDRGAWPDSIAPAALAFDGRIAILTSPVNSSASHMLLRVLPRGQNVTLVGTETGGSMYAHTGGNLFFLSLANTGFETDIPLIAYQWDLNSPRTGVLPDVATSIDDAFARALALLSADGAKTPVER